MRQRTTLAATAVAVGLLGLPAAAPAASFRAGLKAPGHHPKAGKPWTITVTAKSRSGKALRATAFYQFRFAGQVVSTQYPSPHGPDRHAPYRFKGSYRDPILWPKRSVGYDLTFRVVVRVKGKGKRNLDYKVRVRR